VSPIDDTKNNNKNKSLWLMFLLMSLISDSWG